MCGGNAREVKRFCAVFGKLSKVVVPVTVAEEG